MAPDGSRRIVWMIKRMINGPLDRMDAEASKEVSGAHG